MAKIRAYKLAEELGIERNEFVEQARTVGVELKSAMAALEEDQVELLREKLGGAARSSRSTEEKRLEGKRGTTVVRRRRKKAPEPEPEPEPVAAEPEPVVEEVAAEAEVAPIGDEAPEPVAQEVPPVEEETDPGAPEPVAPEPVVPEVAAARPTGPAKPPSGPAGARDAATPATPADTSGGPADRKGKQRKRVREVVNLQEQEQFARQITSRGPSQRRSPAPAPRTMVNPRARRRDPAHTPRHGAQADG